MGWVGLRWHSCGKWGIMKTGGMGGRVGECRISGNPLADYGAECNGGEGRWVECRGATHGR